MLLLVSLALGAELVTGTVVDDKGLPVAGVPVASARVYARGVSYRTDVVSDAQGHFAVPADDAHEAFMVRVQAQTEDGQSSAPAFVTELPSAVTLTLRPAASLELELIGVEPPAVVDAMVAADEIMELGNVQVHTGEWQGGPIVGKAGHWVLTVSQGERAAHVEVELDPGEKRTVRVPMPAPGEIGVTLPQVLRGDRAWCLLTPGEAGNQYGMPTVMDCHDLEPPSMDLGRIAGGRQELEVKQGERRYRYLLDVEGGTWCHFQLPPPEEPAVGGIIGASFAVDSRPARIDGVVAGSPAEGAGLKVGDVVLEVDGVPVATGLAALIAIRLGEERVRLTLGRGGKQQVVKLKRMPPAPEPAPVAPERCGERPRPPEPEVREPYGLPVSKPRPYPLPLPREPNGK